MFKVSAVFLTGLEIQTSLIQKKGSFKKLNAFLILFNRTYLIE
jgi:hypothetical protein